MKRKYFKSASFSVFLRIAALALAIWLLCMTALTIVTARFYMEAFAADMETTQEKFFLNESVGSVYMEEPAYMTSYLLNAIGRIDEQSRYISKARGTELPLWGVERIEYQNAAAVFSAENELMLVGGDGYMSFLYVHTNEEISADRYAYIDLSVLDFDKKRLEAFEAWWDIVTEYGWGYVLRFVGKLDGTEFFPERITYANRTASDWEILYENPNGVSEGSVSVYSSDVRVGETTESTPLEYDDEKYASLAELLVSIGEENAAKGRPVGFFDNSHIERVSLREVMLFSVRTVRVSEELDPDEPMLLYMPFVMRVSPIEAAVNKLLWLYVISFAAASLLALCVFLWIKRRFIDPVNVAYIGAVDGWGYVYTKLDKPTKWKSAAELLRILREKKKE